MTYTTLIENLKANIVRLAAEELEDNTFETAEELYDRVCENWDPVYDTLPIFYNELLDAYFDLRTDCYDEEAMECSNSIIDAVREALRRSLEDELVERREEFIEALESLLEEQAS